MADLRAQSLLSVANRGRTCHGPQAQRRKTAVPRAAAANWQFRQFRPHIQQAHFVLDGGARVVVQRTLCDVDLGGMPCLPIRRSQQSGGSGCTPAFARAARPSADGSGWAAQGACFFNHGTRPSADGSDQAMRRLKHRMHPTPRTKPYPFTCMPLDRFKAPARYWWALPSSLSPWAIHSIRSSLSTCSASLPPSFRLTQHTHFPRPGC